MLANDIDNLKTDKDVEKFIRSQSAALADARISYKDFLYSDFIKQHIADSLGVKLWQKVDFDNNGKTDLLVYLNTSGQDYLTAIIDEGESFSIHFISKWPFQNIYFPVIKIAGTTPELLLYKICSYCHSKNEGITLPDTLIYKFGNFIEPPNSSASHHIEKIEYSTSRCYGTCPVFSLSIDNTRKASYNAEMYNDTTGKFSGTIDTMHYNKIVTLLNYINFTRLRDDYQVNWTDDQTCTLTVTYDGGKTKKISDYGEIGTHGLSMLYGLLFDLRKNQRWK